MSKYLTSVFLREQSKFVVCLPTNPVRFPFSTQMNHRDSYLPSGLRKGQSGIDGQEKQTGCWQRNGLFLKSRASWESPPDLISHGFSCFGPRGQEVLWWVYLIEHPGQVIPIHPKPFLDKPDSCAHLFSICRNALGRLKSKNIIVIATYPQNYRYLILSFLISRENLGNTSFLDFKGKHHHCFPLGLKFTRKHPRLR